jgi:hypothetical protein
VKFAPLVALAAVMVGLAFYHLTWVNELIALAICGRYAYRRRLS